MLVKGDFLRWRVWVFARWSSFTFTEMVLHSHSLITIQVGVSALKRLLLFISMCEFSKPHQAWFLCNHKHPVGLQRNSEKLCPLPDSRDAGDALYLPKFNSHVRCVHYSTHREWQIEISCSSSRMELPWEKVGLNSFKLFPFSLESKSTLYSLLTPFYMTLGSLKFRVFICAAVDNHSVTLPRAALK